MPSWSLTLEVARDEADERAAELVERGAGGVEENDGSYAPMPGTPRPPEGRALLTAFFAERGDAEAAAKELGGRLAELADQDWGEAWKKGWDAFSVGRVFVRPSWIAKPAPPGSVEVVLDPGMAFGTGTHATTSLCLRALDRLLAAHPGASVLDVGTGSGLLAIAAKKLGAGRVAGNDNDPVAVEVARENAWRNGALVELTEGDVPSIRGPFDVVVANILANTLVELAPRVAAQVRPGGTLLLSGLLAPQEDEVARAYEAQGLARREGAREGEWSLVAMARP